MIGTISDAVSVSSITTNSPGLRTGEFFEYTPIGYDVANTLMPFKGYWVKANESGALIFNSDGANPAKASQSRIRIVPSSELPPPPPGDATRTVPEIPKAYALEQSYPNPFNPTTTINYALPVESKVRLTMYNLLGQPVATLVDGIQPAGYNSVEWNASNCASGVYFYRIEATGVSSPGKAFMDVEKTILIK
jgi:hypothetical protein